MKLYEKMYNVMLESEALDKSMSVGTGQNSYKAISEAAVLNVIKPLLKKYKLIIMPIKADISERVDIYNGYKGETARLMTQVSVQYKIIDIESGDFEILASVGNGADSQDKGSGKAWTYAYKAMLQKTFCLFSGEDTDNTHSDDISKSTTSSKPTAEEMERLKGIALKKGYDTKSLNVSCLNSYKKELDKITVAEYMEILKKISSLKDKKEA